MLALSILIDKKNMKRPFLEPGLNQAPGSGMSAVAPVFNFLEA